MSSKKKALNPQGQEDQLKQLEDVTVESWLLTESDKGSCQSLQDPRCQQISCVNPTALVRVSIAVKRCHDQGNSYKGKHSIKVAAYTSVVQSIIILAVSMVLCRQT